MTSSIFIKDEDGNVAGIDPTSKGVILVDTRTARIHKGEAFRAGFFDAALVDDGIINILIKIGANFEAHTVFEAAAGGDAEITIFEGTTVTDDGSSLAAGDRNRTTANTPETTLFSGPTITADGTELAHVLLPGGSGGNASGGSADSPVEFVLKKSTNYLVRVKNIAGATKAFSATMDWYEPGSSA